MNGAATDMGGAHAAPVKPSGTDAAASAPAGKCVIGNQARAHENDCGETSKSISKHDASSLLLLKAVDSAWRRTRSAARWASCGVGGAGP